MKTTKKIPIFLAGLAIATTGIGGNLSVRALSGVSQDLLTMAQEATEEFSLVANVINPYLKIDTIDPKIRGLNGVVSVPEGSDWYIKKIVVAYMNFRQGVSEEEADQNLATLTGRKDNNWNIMSLYENYPWAEKKSQEISLNQAQPQKKIFENEPNIVYYAVELGTVVDGKWGETWWSRGKIDYRSCAHSVVFDKETMSCVRVEDEDMVKYLPRVDSSGALIELPEDEEIVTWEEEWRDIILADYEVIQDETELMWGYLNDGLMILDEDDSILDGILKSVEHYSKADSKLLWVSQGTAFLKGRIAEMRKFYEKNDASDESKIEILERENETLRQANTVLESEKGVLEQANAALESEKTVLGQENGALTAENEALKQEILRLRAENEALKTVGEEEDKEQGNDEAMSEIKSLKQEIERMVKGMAEMNQNAERLETEKMEINIKNTELERSLNEAMIKNTELGQELDRIQAEKQAYEQKMAEMLKSAQNMPEKTDPQKCEVVNIVTEVKEVDDGENGEKELDRETEEKEVEVPNLGGEEVKTSGVWWWLIPVVGLVGVAILLVKRKFARG